MSRYLVGATSDIGVEREKQEDFVQFRELDDSNILCIVADGTGSREQMPQPASIASMHIVDEIATIFKEHRDFLFADPEYFLKKAMLSANRIMGAFKMGNEEVYSGYACSLTCCLLLENQRIVAAHSGNTRLYIIRNGVLSQLTKDHTKAYELLEQGKIDIETYYAHPDRLIMTSGIGVVISPEIQTLSGRLKTNDLVLLTSDGIHYAIQPQAMTDIILNCSDTLQATHALVDAAKNIVKYPDNMSAILVHGQIVKQQ